MLVVTAFGLLAIIGGGLFLAFVGTSGSPVGTGWVVFSYTMGLTMIVLPCTFPLAFVIVPLAMGKGPGKGFAMALAFGAGVAITLSLYGVLAAVLGEVAIGALGAPLEVVKNWLYVFAGAFAFLFALGELGFVKVRMPTYGGAAPMFIQKQRDILKALLLGLFMGNVGIGCPHPATPLILSRIAVSGDVFYGWLLFLVHALGRITPLLLLAILGILGVNALSWVVKRRVVIEHATGWAMVFIAGFILVLGLFTHDWWVNSGQHTLLESITQEERFLGVISDRLQTAAPHTHGPEEGPGLFGLPLWLGNWTLVALWVVPLFWYIRRRQNAALAFPPEEQAKEERVMPWLKAFIVTLTLLLAFIFIWALPHQFLQHTALEGVHEEEEEGMHGMHEGQSGRIEMLVGVDPDVPQPDETTRLRFTFPGTALDEFSITHDRLVHLIIVQEDLATFAHVHPEPVVESPGIFEMEYAFSKSGRYLLAINAVHEGEEVVAYRQLDIPGGDPEAVDRDLRRQAVFDSYDVAFEVEPSAPKAGEETRLFWTVSRDGGLVTDLQPYLAAPMHIALVPEDLSSLIHTHGEIPGSGDLHGTLISVASAHGEEEEASTSTMREEDSLGDVPAAFGPTIEGHVTFDQPGLYAVFGEFRHDRRVIATRFLVEVGE